MTIVGGGGWIRGVEIRPRWCRRGYPERYPPDWEEAGGLVLWGGGPAVVGNGFAGANVGGGCRVMGRDGITDWEVAGEYGLWRDGSAYVVGGKVGASVGVGSNKFLLGAYLVSLCLGSIDLAAKNIVSA